MVLFFVIAPVSCGSLGAVSHTTNVITGIYYTATITYTCVSGYEHTSGTLIRTCQANRNWNGSQPVCSKYSQASKNWNGSLLCVVGIVKLAGTGILYPRV